MSPFVIIGDDSLKSESAMDKNKNTVLSKKNLILLLVFNFLFALVLYSPILNAFFIFDELSLISQCDPNQGKSWIDCLLPIINGFWRPLMLLSGRTLLTLFGYNPVPFHVFPIMLFSVCSVLTSMLGARMGLSRAWCFSSSFLLIAHFGAFPAVSQLGNVNDLFLSASILCGILAFDSWVKIRKTQAWILVCFLVSLASKETGVIFPAILVLWSLRYKGECLKRNTKILFGALFLVSLLSVVKTMLLQKVSLHTYMMDERLGFSLKAFIRQGADYIFSMIFPFIHIAQFPFFPIRLPHVVLWMIRGGIFVVSAVVFIGALINNNKRDWGILLAMAYVAVFFPSLLNTAPEGRFIFSALPFMVLLLCLILRRLKGKLLYGGVAIVCAIWLLFVMGFFRSHTVTGYTKLSRDVEVFIDQAKKAAPAWKKGDHITVFNHPHPGGFWRWSYCQQLFNIFVPEPRVTLVLDRITSKTTHAYRYESSRLKEIEIPRQESR